MDTLIARLASTRLVPVVVLDDPAKAVPLAQALMHAGCGCMEVTFRTAAAAQAIAAVAKEVPDMLIGAGTLLTPQQVEQAQAAGATFGVAPGFDPEIVAAARERNFTFVPGISTASEMSRALGAGCRLLKFFPAEAAGGVKMLKALLGAFRHTGVRIMPTGGINAGNIASWLALPEVVACGGSWICESPLIAAGDWQEIENRTRQALSSLTPHRG